MPRLRLNAFSMNCVSHIHHGQWTDPESRQLEYKSLGPWVELAQLLERGKFDALFLADVVGTYETFRGSRDTSVSEGLQIPVNDPALLIPAMAYATENLGFAFTASVLQEHPYGFARRLSTLDHLTDGRVAWNVVTSYLEGAGRNFGFGALPPHEERYDRAEEYLEVLYKLLEGSWDDDAVLRDLERRIYADPAKVHEIGHSGRFYDVAGPHLSEPSPQRTPVLFQAGSSPRGRDFAARNAEAIFIIARNAQGAAAQVADMRERARNHGRDPGDILLYQGLSAIVGGTEEEALRKAAELDERASDEGYAAHMAGNIGLDLNDVDIEAPINELPEHYAGQSMMAGLIEAAPDKTWKFADLMRWIATVRVVGTPEQIADELQELADVGVGGINLMYYTTPGSFEEFIDGVIPVLQDRGLAQREYRPGTLREKLTDGAGGPGLAETHPGSGFRRQPAAA